MNSWTATLALVCLILMPGRAFSQSPDTRLNWLRTVGNISDESMEVVITDDSGNVYTTGIFRNTVDFDPGPGKYELTAYGAAIFMTKFDANGQFIWATTLGGAGSQMPMDIQVDGDQNIYFCGYFESQFDLLVAGKSMRFRPAGHRDIFVGKLNKNGQVVWAHQWGDISGDQANALHFDKNGNLVVMGSFKGKVDFDPGVDTTELDSKSSYDLFVMKLDTAGNFLWTRHIHSDNSIRSNSLDINDQDQIVIAGQLDGSADFDPGNGKHVLNSSNGQAFVCKLDSVGDLIWATQFGNYNLTRAEAVRYDPQSEIVIGGHFGQTADLDPGRTITKNFTSQGYYDLFLLKLDTNGSLVWVNTYGSAGQNETRDLEIDSLGNIYVSGDLRMTVDFDPGAGKLEVTSNGFQDGFVCKVSPKGQTVWAKGFGGTSNDYAFCLFLKKDEVLLSGSFQGFPDFDFSRREKKVTSKGVFDCYVLSMSECLPTNGHLDTTVCGAFRLPSGDSVVTQSGTYYDTLTNATGCDSFLTIQVTLLPAYDTKVKRSACEVYHSPTGKSYTKSGVYLENLTTRDGCDSLVTLDLTVNAHSLSTLKLSQCISYTVPSGRATYYKSGLYRDTLPNANGCDSVLKIELTVLEVDTSLSRVGNALVVNSTSQKIQWLDCANNYTKIDGATQRIFEPQQSGRYAAQVTENGCTDTSSCHQVLTPTVGESMQPHFQIYPNPSQGLLHLDADATVNDLRMVIYDLSGKTVVDQQVTPHQVLELDLAPGFYTLFVFGGQELLGRSKLVMQTTTH